MNRALAAFAIVMIVASPVVTVAQTTFYEAYAQGLDHRDAGRWREARESFLAAARLRPEPGKRVKTYGLNFLHDYDPYLQLAQVEIRLGMFDRAEGNLARSKASGVSPDAEIDRLRTELDRRRLEQQSRNTDAPTATPPPATATAAPVAPTRLDLRSTPTGADVFLDGRLVGTTPVDLPVMPGDHRVELRRAGHQPRRFTLTVDRSQIVERHFALEPVPTGTRAPEATATRPRPTATLPPAVVPPVATEPANPVPPTATATLPASIPTAAPPPADLEPDRAGILPWQLTVAAGAVLALAAGLLLLFVRKKRQPMRQPSAHTLTPTERLVRPVPTPGTGTPLPDRLQPQFGDYTLRSVLGHGGMATTYYAIRNRDGAPVAVKIPHEHLVQDEEFIQRFVREGSLGATIHHPNIIRIHEAGREGDSPFIAMEFIDGVTLDQRLAEVGALPVREALEITRGIALALDYAHVKGTIHRDLKPENVMLRSDGTVKVMDFGIARVADSPGLTATNAYLGTPLYSAPESLTPAEIDDRTDLYTLGIILYRMLTNSLPFEASSPLRLFEMHRDLPLPEFPRSLTIPHEVVDMVRKLTAKRKDDRYRSAETLLQELNRILNKL